ncbi:MAG: DUF4198 domain-containing protein [Heliomarina sp.]|uniref:DUF4198 domain-containing protein n=1 Tax=Heliomarina sp. TaxID=2917556 RepID=UPI004059CAAB
MCRGVLTLSVFIWLVSSFQTLAHEFWIAPEDYQVQPGAPLSANLRNGQEFKGINLPYFNRNTERFEIIREGDIEPVTSRMGNIPALETTAGEPGLLVILHETAPATLTYEDWDTFARFIAHKDFGDIESRHTERGLPREGFREIYRRFAKALVAVGDGTGTDSVSGMETEFVALTNPYTNTDDSISVRLLYQDTPRRDAQVEVFDKAPDDTVTITYLRTDENGEVTVPLTPGHRYLLDAVVLREAPQGSEAVWESLWAALTFARP